MVLGRPNDCMIIGFMMVAKDGLGRDVTFHLVSTRRLALKYRGRTRVIWRKCQSARPMRIDR